MISRIWHGRTNLSNKKSYLQFLLGRGTSEYLESRGNVSVKIWQSDETDASHFWTVTEWDDLEAVKRFAGNDPSKAKYYREDENILLEFEENVKHYQCYEVSRAKVGNFQRQLTQLYSGGELVGRKLFGKAEKRR